MERKKIFVVGSCNTDMVIKSDRLPIPGETVIGGTFLMNAGGKGANQAVAAARLGGVVTFIAKTGNDVFGRQSLENFNSEGINTDLILSDPKNPSGVALIMVNSNGENCIMVASGSNGNLKTKDIEKFKNQLAEADFILMQLEIPMETVEYVVELASEKKIPVILNPAPAKSLSEKVLKGLYLITPNETEAEILSGVKVTNYEKAKEAADIISEKGVANVVITMGESGAFVKEGSNYTLIKAIKVNAVDTTAAGDCFNGTLCVGLSEGKSITESVKLAVKAAGLCVQKMGAQSSLPYKKELTSIQ
ncbi:ribokinase [Flavobacterium aquidurense]